MDKKVFPEGNKTGVIGMLQAFFIMGGLGIIIGVGLAVASKIFYVYVDPKILAVESAYHLNPWSAQCRLKLVYQLSS